MSARGTPSSGAADAEAAADGRLVVAADGVHRALPRAATASRFTIRPAGERPFVFISDPGELKQLFTAPPDVLHPGEGARILGPLVGQNSILLLDEDAHMTQKRLVLPAFHGDRLAALSELVAEVTREEVGRWPRGEPIAIHGPMQALTMEVILRAVFGLDVRRPPRSAARRADRDDRRSGCNPASLFPPAQRTVFGRGPWAAFVAARGARRRADLRRDPRAPRRPEPTATTCSRRCCRPRTRTARRCRTRRSTTSCSPC